MSDARTELQKLADQLGEWATERFNERGPSDPRGAALWDVAGHITETVIPSLPTEEPA